MIPEWVKQYIGIEFRACGRDRSGCDCWGLARMVWAEQFGVDVPSFCEYRNSNDPKEIGPFLSEKIVEYPAWMEVPTGVERVGDGLLIRAKGTAMHVGIVVGGGLMLHIYAGANACLESYRGPKWSKRVLGFYRNRAMA